MSKLFEDYKKRLTVSESVFGKTHSGEKMDSHRKIVVAQCMRNVDRFLSEAFESSMGTQRADMGNYKRFCLNLVTVGLPNLIAHDLVMVSPMTSITGYVAYIEYTTGTTKGDDVAPRMLNNPFELGASNTDMFADYTSDRVVETLTSFTSGTTAVAWTPVNTSAGFKCFDADGAVIEGATIDPATGVITSATAVKKVAYVYDNVVIPQNTIPTIKAEMKNITLEAKARRIGIYYSQIAAFQAKTDYGFDLGDQLAEKAVGQLNFEIDTEIVRFLNTLAGEAKADLAWSKTLPIGVSKTEHYAGFAEVVEIAKQIIYDATQRFAPNYMVCASNILPVLSFINQWKPVATSNINGPYFAGTFGSLKVFVSPTLDAGEYLIGVNGEDYMSSAAVYAPYMMVVPTQLMQFNDGGTTQGFSTMYDLKALNKNLIVKGKITA